MERGDLLKDNGKIFTDSGKYINVGNIFYIFRIMQVETSELLLLAILAIPIV